MLDRLRGDGASFDVNLDFSLKTLFPADFGIKDLSLLETLSTGLFGRTRLARSLRDREYYSLKITKKARVVKASQLVSVQNEVLVLTRLRCRFAIDVRAVFQDEHSLYLLTEFIAGGELFSYIRRSGRLDSAATQFYAIELACALYHLHKCGIIYRDLKPESVAINRFGHIRLIDFSLCKPTDGSISTGGMGGCGRTFTLCGTPEYVAPEVILGAGYGAAVDWWSLGVLIHEMTVGFPPFIGRTPFIVYRRTLAGVLNFDDKIVPRPTQEVITAFLNGDFEKRLGAGSFAQLRAHRFFNGVDWPSAFRELLVPPYVPTVMAAGDSSNYDFYPEELVEEPANLTREERDMFASIDHIIDRG